MKELIPWVGDRKAKQRLDELFSRKTLGSVLFGAAVSKLVEKINVIVVSLIIIFAFPVEISASMWLAASLLLIWWQLELILFIYIYIRWEKAMEQISEVAEDAKEKAKQKKEDVKDKAKKED